MSAEEPGNESQIIQPSKALPRKYIAPILYLADRMSSADKNVVVKERTLIEQLAEAASRKDFRSERWYKEFTQETACSVLDIDAAKRGALVVLSLVLKADSTRLESEHEYFTKIRTMLGAQPVIVPKDLEAHKQLAMKYVAG